jgi:NADH-quinone oxidoreductase subunit J
MHIVLFYIFGGLAVAGAINLLIQRAPINSALSLVVVMGALAVLYLLLGAEFIAFIQVLVYAGAIMVLFVFVIMLLNAQPSETGRGSRVARLLGMPVLALLIIVISGVVLGAFPPDRFPVRLGDYMIHVEPIGNALFHAYLLPFEVTSVLFLVGIVGAVVLAARGDEHPGDLDPSLDRYFHEPARTGASGESREVEVR